MRVICHHYLTSFTLELYLCLRLDSFMSVKFEFHDLDGLRWTQTSLRRQQVYIVGTFYHIHTQRSSRLGDRQYYRRTPQIGLVISLQYMMLTLQFEYQQKNVEI